MLPVPGGQQRLPVAVAAVHCTGWLCFPPLLLPPVLAAGLYTLPGAGSCLLGTSTSIMCSARHVWLLETGVAAFCSGCHFATRAMSGAARRDLLRPLWQLVGVDETGSRRLSSLIVKLFALLRQVARIPIVTRSAPHQHLRRSLKPPKARCSHPGWPLWSQPRQPAAQPPGLLPGPLRPAGEPSGAPRAAGQQLCALQRAGRSRQTWWWWAPAWRA